MVSANAERSSMGIANTLRDRDFRGIAAFAALGAGGLFVGQEVVDQVMPLLGMSPDPTSPSGLGAAMLAKVVTAGVIVAVASRAGDLGMMAGGLVSGGVLISAGLDLVDLMQRGSLPGMSPSGGSSGSSSSGTMEVQPAPQPAPAPSPSASSGSGTRAAGYR